MALRRHLDLLLRGRAAQSLAEHAAAPATAIDRLQGKASLWACERRWGGLRACAHLPHPVARPSTPIEVRSRTGLFQRRWPTRLVEQALGFVLLAGLAGAQVEGTWKISNTEGGFVGALGTAENFASSIAPLGNFFGQGGTDVVVGSRGSWTSDGPTVGAVWLLGLSPDGLVRESLKLDAESGGMLDPPVPGEAFGSSVAAPGDLDGDGVGDLVVGGTGVSRAGAGAGGLWILLMNADGTAKQDRRFDFTGTSFPAELDNLDAFGTSLVALGDVNGDGVADVAVGAPGDDDGGSAMGCVYVLFLGADGEVSGYTKISATRGGFTGALDPNDRFGSALALVGDSDGDGLVELAVTAMYDDDGASNRGAIWILELGTDGRCVGHQKYSHTTGGTAGKLAGQTTFGRSIVVGDVDGNGWNDFVVGSLDATLGYTVWVGLRGFGGQVLSTFFLAQGTSGFTGELVPFDRFGNALAIPGDIDGDGRPDLCIGAQADPDGGPTKGAMWNVFLGPGGQALGQAKISDTSGNLNYTLDNDDRFGSSVASAGDVDGDGIEDIFIGAPGDDDTGHDRGAVWLFFLAADRTVKSHTKFSGLSPELFGRLADDDLFGSSVASVGDLNGDGTPDVAIGAPGSDEAFKNSFNIGAVYVLLLRPNGGILAVQKLSRPEMALRPGERFGTALASARFFPDSRMDIIVGSPGVSDGFGPNRGGLWIIDLGPDGSFLTLARISDTDSVPDGGLQLGDHDLFGSSVADAGDIDGDGVHDIAVGVPGETAGGVDAGGLWLLMMKANGDVREVVIVSAARGNFSGDVGALDNLGTSLATLPDLNGDGRPELLLGASGDDDAGQDAGCFYIVYLNARGRCISFQKVRGVGDAFEGTIEANDSFAASAAMLGDGDGNGWRDLLIGVSRDDDGGPDRGAVWLTELDPNGSDWFIEPYSCVNPPDTLTVDDGTARLGSLLKFKMPNPFNSQTPLFTRGFLATSLAPRPEFPCGLTVPSWGLQDPDADGEFLISLAASDFIQIQSGSANPPKAELMIPNQLGLVGVTLYVQGVAFDLSGAFGVDFALTEGLALRIGR